jgi:two-component system NtrC family sensor kinase
MPLNHIVSEDELDWRLRVFESLSFPTLILKPDKTIVAANERYLEKFNVSQESIIGKTCHEVFYGCGDKCPRDYCPLPKVLEDRKGHSTINRIVTDDGHEAWEDRVFSPILDENGEVKYIIDSLRDVTHVKKLEKELGETKEFLEQAIDSSPSAIMAADMTGQIVVINPAAEELFGYSAKNQSRLNVEDMYPPGLAREIMRKLRDPQIGGKGKLPSTKITITNARGEEIPAELTAAIIYEGDRETATMGIFHDLREKLAVEAKLRAAQENLVQAEKMASLGQLAAGVAHEVNNPLTGILFYSNLALEQMEPAHPLREHLQYVIEDVHRCKDIVKNLLAYSRQTTQTKDIFHLNTLVEQGLGLIRDQKVFRNVDVVRDLSDHMMMLQADKNQLSQVIINLVMNAVDAMDGKGRITLRTWRDKAAQKVFLEVADTGCGIPYDNLPKIFDPFFTTKELGKGTGLGLSTAYGIVKENGGEIRVKETGPEGTTFLVELPMYSVSEDPDQSNGHT